ncbi:hypothetical protein RvY_18874 [Ramazzottius varieornatus]|uniref:t-SNARE coiled-coil homology domain-containing protein n=1 Tax=Ramazzottius varieornatus TaxID=947166 RepID=A0A1D1W7D1_RAMVA|nr:hypothetical protein RvY_18874 [Ramazzottius varieornatus]
MAPKDRLGDFLNNTGRNSFRNTFSFRKHRRLSETPYVDQPRNSTHGRIASSSDTDSLDSLLMKVEKVSQSIELLAGRIAKIKSLQQSILAFPLPDSDAHQDLQRCVQEFRVLSSQTRTLLLDLDRQNQLAEGNGQIAQARIGKVQQSGLARRLTELVSEYGLLQNTYHKQCVQRLKRQLQIAGNSDLSDEKVNEILDSDNPRPLIFTQGIIAESDKAKETLRDLEARHDELKTLEKSIIEVHGLFADVALMIEAQGETVNKIETTVDLTSSTIENTGSLLKEAQKMRKRARHRKTKLIIATIILLILVALTIFLAVYFG